MTAVTREAEVVLSDILFDRFMHRVAELSY
jgi:hypothetical protein